jgi:ABC transporter substrate binding protein
VDIICTAGTPATLATKQATARIPIVFAAVAFPERTGVVENYARPGGNLTGVAFIGPEYGKRLELLREIAVSLSRVVLLYNDKNPASLEAMKETRQWAGSLRVALDPLGVHDRSSLETALAAMRRRPPDAVMTTADPLISSYRTLIVEFANKHRLLSMFPNRDYVDLGGLVFYGTSTTDMWRRAAIYVDRILSGATIAGGEGEKGGTWGPRDVAEAWDRGAAARAQTFGAATERMLELANVIHGSRVLDIAAGAGDQALMAARRGGPTARDAAGAWEALKNAGGG